jgi:flagellar biosynthesis/type III secretory pathway chaperone
MTEKVEIQYFTCTDIWNRFCELHYQLFQLTCTEYGMILGSDIEGLEVITLQKEEVIQKIGELEQARSKLILEIQSDYKFKLERASSLIDFFTLKIAAEREHKHLYKYNLLLIDLINQLKAQNKKNQSVLNKTIRSLSELRETAQGIKSFTVYNSKGASQKVSSPTDRG